MVSYKHGFEIYVSCLTGGTMVQSKEAGQLQMTVWVIEHCNTIQFMYCGSYIVL